MSSDEEDLVGGDDGRTSLVPRTPTPPARQQLPVGPQLPEVKYKRNKCSLATTWIFYFLCFFTGQFIASPKKKEVEAPAERRYRYLLIFLNVLSFVFLTMFISVNAGSLVFSVLIVAVCPFKDCGYIYEVTSNVTWENISFPNSSLLTEPAGLLPLEKYEDWQKTVITTASFAGLMSYVFMVCVLYSQYGPGKRLFQWLKEIFPSLWKLCGDPGHHHKDRDDQKLALNPFDDSSIIIDVNNYNPPSKSTLLTSEQATYFGFFFTLNFLLWVSSVAIFFVIYDQKVFHAGKTKLLGLDTTGLVMQFLSQMCAIFSCFIFSKAAYGVSNQCIDVREVIFPKADDLDPDGINDNLFPDDPLPDNCNNKHFTLLKKMDQRYVRTVAATLDPYGKWFAIHWVLYTITAFMAIAYVADAVMLELYGTEEIDKECHGEHPKKCILSLTYQLLFAVQHLILFLYPCFRGANVTASRNKMLTAVSKMDWEYVPLDEKDSFIQYLKDQHCSFKITILCAKFSFGFNTAFVSIFIGMLGVLLKLSS